ncbi:MAG: hypothetical protein WA936_05590 [Erythrobacter sp.]
MMSLMIALALQAASTTAPAPNTAETAPIETLDELPIEQAAAPRCGIAFAVVSRWQKTGDPRGDEYEDVEESGGREFFVRTMANLMERRDLSREELLALVETEVQALDNVEGAQRIEGMMPACSLMKETAGL